MYMYSYPDTGSMITFAEQDYAQTIRPWNLTLFSVGVWMDFLVQQILHPLIYLFFALKIY